MSDELPTNASELVATVRRSAARGTGAHPADAHFAGEAGEADGTDTGARRQTLLVWLGITVFVVLWTFLIGQALFGWLAGEKLLDGRWLVSPDAWPPIRGGRTMLYGGWLTPYARNANLVAMPLYPAVTLPVSAIVDIFSIPNPEVSAAITATSTTALSTLNEITLRASRSPLSPVLMVWNLLWLIPFLITVRALAWSLGVRRRLWRLQVLAFVLGWFPMVVIFAHLEDGLILTLVMYAIVLARRKQWMQVAITLALALSLKQSAALVVPLFFFFVPKGDRLRFALVTVSLPLALVAIVLLADYPSASRSLFFAPTFPDVGMARSTWFTTAVDGVITAGPIRIGAPILALLLAWWLRRNRSLLLLTAGVGLAFFTRLPFEAVIHQYYVAPVYIFAVVYERRRNGRAVWAPVFGLLSMTMFWFLEFTGWPFWSAQTLVFAAATWPMFVDVARRRFGGRDGDDLEMPECGVGTEIGPPTLDRGDDARPHGIGSGDGTSAPSDGVIL